MVVQSNPWLNVDWNNTLADNDKSFPLLLKKGFLFQQDTLPEPYNGNVKSKVYCLGMNPGEKDFLFEMSKSNRDLLLKYSQKNLSHKIKDNMWFHLYEHNGYCWWRKITSELRKELRRNPQMFIIEYFPYHSKNGFKFPTNLPSYSYSNWLIEKAIKDHKYILILRHKTQWFNRIKRLESYERLFYIDPRKSRYLVISKSNILKGKNCTCDINDLINNF